MGKGWVVARNLWDSTVNVATGSFMNLSDLQSRGLALKKDLEAKGYKDTPLTFMQRWVYLVANIPSNEHELRDLITLAYAYFLKEIILETKDNEFLFIDFNLMRLTFMTLLAEYVGEKGLAGKFNKRRLAGVKNVNRGAFEVGGELSGKIFGETTTISDWEGMKQKIREKNLASQFRQKELLDKFGQVNDQIKRIIVNTYKGIIPDMYESYYERCDSPEKRGDEVKKQLFANTALQASFKKLFEDIIYQDQYFSIFNHMFIRKGGSL